MICHSSKVLIEDVQEIALLRDIKELLVVRYIISFKRLVWIKVFLNRVYTLLESVKGLVAYFTQVKRINVGLLGFKH